MKNLSHHLKQAFDALEFANVSQLHELTARLDQRERSAPPARTGHHNAAQERDMGTIAASNSPCF